MKVPHRNVCGLLNVYAILFCDCLKFLQTGIAAFVATAQNRWRDCLVAV